MAARVFQLACVRRNPAARLLRSATAALHCCSACLREEYLIAEPDKKAKLIDGKKMAKAIRKEVAAEVKRMQRAPHLAAIVVGDNEDSHLYVSNKMKDAKKCGISAQKLDKTASQEELIELLDELNRDDEVDGILVQSPLPEGICEYTVFNSVAPEKDVDAFHILNTGHYCAGGPKFVPATPLGILEILRRCSVPTLGRNVCVVDRDKKVGFAVATLLHSDGTGDATTTICHEHTPLEQLSEMTKLADIVITGRNKAGLIKGDMVKEGAIVIDFGIAVVEKEDGSTKLVGDVDFEEVSQVASLLTPALGGVWPVSIAMLMKNTLLAAQKQHRFDFQSIH